MTKYAKVKHNKGYWLVFVPSHPIATRQGYVPEHRLVMEKSIGGYISPASGLEVHHINGDKGDNRIENLQLLSHQDHMRIERGWKKEDNTWNKPCTSCKKLLPLEAFYKRKDGRTVTVCRACNTSYCKKGRNRWR